MRISIIYVQEDLIVTKILEFNLIRPCSKVYITHLWTFSANGARQLISGVDVLDVFRGKRKLIGKKTHELVSHLPADLPGRRISPHADNARGQIHGFTSIVNPVTNRVRCSFIVYRIGLEKNRVYH
jgi:hypothetical protein